MINRCKLVETLSAYCIVFKVIKEGYKLRDKIVLFLSIFNSLVCYLRNKISNRSIRLCYYLLRDCLTKNQSGIFHCRASTNDAIIVSEAHERELKPYFDEFRQGNFLDVGAHIGKYTVQLASQVQYSSGKVIAIEAHPQNFKALVQNIELNQLSNVTALNVACWDRNGEIKLYRDSGSTATSSYSAAKRFQGDYISIEARKLDDILNELKVDTVDFMKVDIEGAEFECFQGARGFLKENKIARILFECSDVTWEKCKSILEEYDYTIKCVGMPYYLADSSRWQEQ